MRTYRSFCRISLAALLILLALAIPGPASAQGACDELIVDQAGVFTSGIDQVQSAAQQLQSAGGDPRIITIPTYGNAGGLDKYLDQLQANCPSWVDSNGKRKHNLVVFSISMKEHATWINYGSQWHASLDNNYTRIQTDLMNPAFKAGDFAGGFVAGINEVTRLITAQLHPQTVPAAPAPAPVVMQPAQPRDYSGVLRVIMYFVLAILVVAVLFGLSRWYAGYREEREREREKEERRHDAQRRAILAQQQASALFVDEGRRMPDLQLSLDTLRGSIAPDDLGDYEQRLRAIQSDLTGLSSALDRLGNLQPGDPGLSIGEYNDITDQYRALSQQFGSIPQAIASLNEDLNQLAKAVKQGPKAVEATRETLELANQAVGAVAEQQFFVNEANDLLTQAEALLTQAAEAIAGKRIVTAGTLVRQARDLAAKAVQSAQGLQQQRDLAEGETVKLKERIADVTATVQDRAGVLELVMSTFVEPSWRSVKDNVTGAQSDLASASTCLAEAQRLSSMTEQRWPEAMSAIQLGNDAANSAERGLSEITKLAARLESARTETASNLDHLQQRAAKVMAYILRYDEDIREQPEEQLKGFQEEMVRLARQLNGNRPDYLAIADRVDAIASAVEGISEIAEEEHQAMESLRSAAVDALNDAEAAYISAEEYIDNHRSYVKRTAKTRLAEAHELLERARKTTDLQKRISLAHEAEAMAESARSKAKADYNKEKRSRESTYSTGGVTYVDVSSSTPSYSPPSTSSDSGGGGGTFWGGSDSGGGGGTSWGTTTSSDGGGGGGTTW